MPSYLLIVKLREEKWSAECQLIDKNTLKVIEGHPDEQILNEIFTGIGDKGFELKQIVMSDYPSTLYLNLKKANSLYVVRIEDLGGKFEVSDFLEL